ncbi:hypothetical protein D6T64_11970 [Cryobacterium melibiosiphilum]|uniref:Uncharacterized protein n=1 Tax=Cryobacterium melibiosiphilum TaxID=995039 RepID=A0A3A5MDA1_9MICO|nr:hypothetical protein [Cryobacterium melibiosiphilum]RJT88100.1 hypothetical protein D6T64_11970 [Cryobacterium melibiosiphilum]
MSAVIAVIVGSLAMLGLIVWVVLVMWAATDGSLDAKFGNRDNDGYVGIRRAFYEIGFKRASDRESLVKERNERRRA